MTISRLGYVYYARFGVSFLISSLSCSEEYYQTIKRNGGRVSGTVESSHKHGLAFDILFSGVMPQERKNWLEEYLVESLNCGEVSMVHKAKNDWHIFIIPGSLVSKSNQLTQKYLEL